MGLGNGWELGTGRQRQLYLLELLYDRAGGRPNRYVTIDRADASLPFPGDGSTAGALADAVEGLRQLRLVHYVVHSGPVPNVPPRVELTPAGVAEVERIRRIRADPAARRPAARDALLRWLYQSAGPGGSPEVADFRGRPHASFWGAREFFTATEVRDASRWLLDHGYVTGDVNADGSIARLSITPEGEELVESDRSTRDDRKTAGDTTITITNSPGASVAERSPGAVQVSFVTMNEEGQRRIGVAADYLEQFAEQLDLPEQAAHRLPEVVAGLRAIAREPAPERGRLKRLLDSARELAIAAGSIPLGAGLQALILEAAHALGIG